MSYNLLDVLIGIVAVSVALTALIDAAGLLDP